MQIHFNWAPKLCCVFPAVFLLHEWKLTPWTQSTQVKKLYVFVVVMFFVISPQFYEQIADYNHAQCPQVDDGGTSHGRRAVFCQLFSQKYSFWFCFLRTLKLFCLSFALNHKDLGANSKTTLLCDYLSRALKRIHIFSSNFMREASLKVWLFEGSFFFQSINFFLVFLFIYFFGLRNREILEGAVQHIQHVT